MHKKVALSFFAVTSFFVSHTAIAEVVTITPLSNPGFEFGITGWAPYVDSLNATLNDASPHAATEGSNYYGKNHVYTTNSSGISTTLLGLQQMMSVAELEEVDSVTFGGDFFGSAEITSGSGAVELQQPATGGIYLHYFDENLIQLGHTLFSVPNGEDISLLAGYSANDIRITLTDVPVGTENIRFRIFASVVVRDQGPGSVSASFRYGVDDLFFSATGSAVSIPEPSALALLAVAAPSMFVIRCRKPLA